MKWKLGLDSSLRGQKGAPGGSGGLATGKEVETTELSRVLGQAESVGRSMGRTGILA